MFQFGAAATVDGGGTIFGTACGATSGTAFGLAAVHALPLAAAGALGGAWPCEAPRARPCARGGGCRGGCDFDGIAVHALPLAAAGALGGAWPCDAPRAGRSAAIRLCSATSSEIKCMKWSLSIAANTLWLDMT